MRCKLAAVLLAAASLSPTPDTARAFEPGLLPEPLWWRAAPALSLAENPLGALRDRALFRSDAEWAPLYDGRDGARFERARRSLELRTEPGPWRAGMEMRVRQDLMRGGDDPKWLGTERLRSTLAVVGLARESEPFGVGGAVMRDQEHLGFAAETRARIGTLGQAWWSWSRVPEGNRLAARWDDVEVLAQGRWIDQRVAWKLDIASKELSFALGQEALDRRPLANPETAGDRLHPALAWRATSADLATHRLDARWAASLSYGEGREGLRVVRGETPYATATGKVFRRLASLEVTPDRAPVQLHAWTGSWSRSARGSLSLWPFDPLATLAGTRRLALSSGSLTHHGFSIDRPTPVRTGLGGGLALCWLVPRASYESWEARYLGLGRDDEDAGESDIRGALVVGARLAGAVQWHGVRAGVELVQWIPLRVDRVRSDVGDGGSGGGSSGGSTSAGNDRGGTLVRVSLSQSRAESGVGRLDH